jgi:protein ImuB
MRIPSYDDLTPSIPDVSADVVFAPVQRLLSDSGPVTRGTAPAAGRSGGSLFACLRSTRNSGALMEIARDFSPRVQRYGAECVVLDVSGLGSLLGDANAIGAELARATADKCGALRTADSGERTASIDDGRHRPRFTSRYGIRIEPHPVEHGNLSIHTAVAGLNGTRIIADSTDDGTRIITDSTHRTREFPPGRRLVDEIRVNPRPVDSTKIREDSRPVNPSKIREDPRPVDSTKIREDPRPVNLSKIREDSRPVETFAVAVAPTQLSALLASLGGSRLTVITANVDDALAPLPLRALWQLMSTIHGVTVLRPKASAIEPATGAPGWPAWPACEEVFDVLQRWGLKTLGEFAALPAVDLSARLGNAGVALQQLARGIDPRPLVPDPDVPRYREQMVLEWPIDSLEPLSFVLARLLDSLSLALERADRGAAAIRLDLRLVDRSTHSRMLQLPVAMRDARVLRTLLLLDLESHAPGAAIDIVTIEVDPAPGRVLQYSLLERALPSAETIATLTARLGALVGESRCGAPVLLDSYRPDAFELQRFAPAEVQVRARPAHPGAVSAAPSGPRVPLSLRRFRPPVAIRVVVERGRPAQVAIDRRGMPGGQIVQAAGPWRSSGEWWTGAARHWDRDEWDVSFSDGATCRLFKERESERWFMEGVFD